jgi:hypothetical protein
MQTWQKLQQVGQLALTLGKKSHASMVRLQNLYHLPVTCLADMMKYLDTLGVYDQSIADPFLLLDGHHS